MPVLRREANSGRGSGGHSPLETKRYVYANTLLPEMESELSSYPNTQLHVVTKVAFSRIFLDFMLLRIRYFV